MFCYEDAFLIKCFKMLVTYTRKCLYFDWLREIPFLGNIMQERRNSV